MYLRGVTKINQEIGTVFIVKSVNPVEIRRVSGVQKRSRLCQNAVRVLARKDQVPELISGTV